MEHLFNEIVSLLMCFVCSVFFLLVPCSLRSCHFKRIGRKSSRPRNTNEHILERITSCPELPQRKVAVRLAGGVIIGRHVCSSIRGDVYIYMHSGCFLQRILNISMDVILKVFAHRTPCFFDPHIVHVL